MKQLPKSWLGLVLLPLLGGCVYDPYSHQWVPCCAYGYGYGYNYPPPYYPAGPYGYPNSASGYPNGAPGYAYGGPTPESQQGYPSAYPYGAPAPGQQQENPPAYAYGAGAQGPQQGYPPGPASAAPGNGGGLAQRFAVANVTHDGRLTREQAERGMPFVARNFDGIDLDHKGYVTLPEIRAFAAQRRAGGGQPGPEE